MVGEKSIDRGDKHDTQHKRVAGVFSRETENSRKRREVTRRTVVSKKGGQKIRNISQCKRQLIETETITCTGK